jgi:competence protein ComEC
MRLHDIAFYTAIFFIIGIFAGSIVNGWSYTISLSIFISIAAAGLFWFYGKKAIIFFIPIIIAGSLYYLAYDKFQKTAEVIYDQKINLEGVVRKVELYSAGQKIYVENIKIYAPNYPVYEYGMRVSVAGVIKRIKPGLENIFLKDGVRGTMSYPEIKVLAYGEGNPAIAWLLKLKTRTLQIFTRVLPYQKSQFLAGITLGEKSAFSEDFKNDLSRSGTSHLVALSGYNISVIAENLAVSGGFFLTLAIIILFVLMTGAEASIVRAAIMGGLILLASRVNRIYSFRNAVTIVAFFMVVHNPKILAFDLSFQLSFAALLGIVYLRPIIAKTLRMKMDSGFLEWRKNLQSTLAAQIAVLPLILKSFGTLSLSGVFANILILPAIPYTMFLGLLISMAGLVSDYTARAIGFFTEPFITYELGLIKFFGQFGYAEGIQIGWLFVFVYYAILIWLVRYFKKHDFERSTK